MPESPSASAPVNAGAVGVLFDVDDTLVDLRTAMRVALLGAAQPELAGLSEEGREEFAEHFSRDEAGYYDAYVRGELGFAQQRHLRLQAALEPWGVRTGQDVEGFSARFEALVSQAWRAFADVGPALDLLDELGVAYGAVTNNAESYQRQKLAAVGPERITVVIGSDTAGAPKPDPRSYLAGVAALGTAAHLTLMVGDNPEHDVAGARRAGLPALLVDRFHRYPDQGAVGGLTPVVEWARMALNGPVR